MKQFLLIWTIIAAGITLACMWPSPKASLPTESTPSTAQLSGNPEELGAVHWLRDLDAGQAEARRSGKPMLILFQEVPGCSNCTRFGNTTLSHPLIVEAIETFFVPVCIYNNKGGKDAEALRRFQEPAWNNPVVRIVSAELRDIVPRMPEFYAPSKMLQGIRLALENSRSAVPQYLQALEEELSGRESGLQTATFSMYCFWSGEGVFGGLPGVVETAPGYQGGREVVQVWFDPRTTSRVTLETLAKPNGIQACPNNEGFRPDREPKYYLAQTLYRYVPMTALQACRVNHLIGKGASPEVWLSPRQLQLFQKIKANPQKSWKNMIGCSDLAKAWAEVSG